MVASYRNTRRRNASRRHYGAVSVEAALVLPMCLIFLLGIMEYGRFVMIQQVVTNAAREGCRYALTHVDPVTINGVTTGNSTSNVLGVVNNALAGQSLSSQNIQVYASDTVGNNTGAWTSAGAGQSICVQITGNYIPVIARYLYLPASIPVKAQCVMRAEGS